MEIRSKKDNEKCWTTIDIPTTDLDINGMFEWSSYHSHILSDDKKFMHIAFISYDDNKENNPEDTSMKDIIV